MPQNRSNTSSSVNASTSYVSAAKSVPKPIHPKREQAIIFHAEGEFKLLDYAKAVGDIIGAKNISFISRISNNRICIYLSKTQLVDQLIESHPSITIGDTEFNIRRLISPTKRIVISNICPSIPHDIAEDALKNLGLHLASPVSFLKAGIPGDEYSHILSFRRQAYVFSSTEKFELQTSILIPYDGNEYRIFISTDKMECFICRQSGHIASNCPNPLDGDTSHQNEKGPSNSNNHEQITTDNELAENSGPDQTSSLTTPQKRNLSQISTTSNPNSQVSETSSNASIAAMPPPNNSTALTKSTKQTKKKRKTDLTSGPEHMLSENTKSIIKGIYEENPAKFVIPVDHFFAFLQNTFDNNNPYDEVLKFTKDVRSLLSNMYFIYPSLKERALKNRFTRLTKKIKSHLSSEEIEGGSICSILTQSSIDSSDQDLDVIQYTQSSDQTDEPLTQNQDQSYSV
ncbi:hypothetical protein HHI36_007228 [Cryptolaemus montrouzieri]|uniref:CCHC-type domain-containing protein n=1 Tax=Cryptolaemus montrouzieri TaxID=559131 RepID=A0ABD2MNZ5_9CUCU